MRMQNGTLWWIIPMKGPCKVGEEEEDGGGGGVDFEILIHSFIHFLHNAA